MRNIGDEIDALSNRAKIAITKSDDEQIDKLFEALRLYTKPCYRNENRAHAHYNLCNLHGELSSTLKEKPSGWRSGNFPENLTAAINNIRIAYSLDGNYTDKFISSIRANLATALANQGRGVEVINDWICDFSIPDNAASVSSLSKARALIAISKLLNDENHQSFYVYEAFLLFKKLEDNKDNIDHPAVIDALQTDNTLLKFLDNKDWFVPISGWSTKYKSEEYQQDEQKDEKAYRLWCLKNRLFANPLNDITTEWIAAEDTLRFPDYTTDVDGGAFFPASFSALKREYCFARFMAYEGIHKIHPKFETDKLFLADTLCGVDYSGASEKIKTGFRVCFSVLDSIASLMNNYFDCKSNDVGFNPQWIKDNFKDLPDNRFIDSLYWLSCDLFDNKKITSDPEKWKAPDPESPEIRLIRNKIEHGWLRVTETKHDLWDQHKDFAYTITPKKLKNQTILVLKLVRYAMLYLAFAIKHHDNNRNADDKNTNIYFPIPIIDDDDI